MALVIVTLSQLGSHTNVSIRICASVIWSVLVIQIGIILAHCIVMSFVVASSYLRHVGVVLRIIGGSLLVVVEILRTERLQLGCRGLLCTS